MPEDSARVELERLRRETEALNEQVKLLVQTEQRLYHSQAQLDAQLTRLRSLARFALESTGADPTTLILGRALDVLGAGFDVDWLGAARLEPAERAVTLLAVGDGPAPGSRPIPLDESAWQWVNSLRDPIVVWSAGDADPVPIARLMQALAPEMACRDPEAWTGGVACLPLRSVGDDRPGVLLGCVVKPKSHMARERSLDPVHLPFLQLLVNHVEHEIANARLTASLTERSAQLASSLSALETAQQELLQAQKLEAMGQLAGGVAHDFNNLLTVILGYAGTLQASLHPDAPQQESVGHILEAGRRAAGITAQLLALGRRQLQRREPLDLSAQTERTAGLLQHLVGEQIRLEIDLDRSLEPVHADRGQIEQVILNLVVNARDAMPEGGAMRISTRRASAADTARCQAGLHPGAYAVLEIEDSGTGMDEATQRRIFEPFFTTKPSGKGSGLGLAVVYGIVKQSDGHVLVDSRVGEGSRFTVLLPFARLAGPAILADELGVAGSAPSVRATILVVDDEAVIREIVAATLRGAGHTVHEASNGSEALQRIESLGRDPDLILTDVVMPEMGGIKLAAELRRRRSPIRIAFMSGYSEDLLEVEVGGRDARFLSKPFTPQVLLAFVAKQLTRAEAPSV